MEKKTVLLYEAPAVNIIDVRQEGILCQSGGLGGRGGYDPDDDNPFAG